MSDNKSSDLDDDFGFLVADAMRDLGGSVGEDRPSELIKEPSETQSLPHANEFAIPRLSPSPHRTKGGERWYDNHQEMGVPHDVGWGPEGNPAVGAASSEIATNAEYRVWYGTNRKPIVAKGELAGFSSDRDTRLHYGQCRVFVPKSHKIGLVGSPFWKRLLTWNDDRLNLLAIDPFTQASFWKAVAAQLQPFEKPEKTAVVFIHGYNVSFSDAALRAAQIGFDLSIATPMAFFSWPSRGRLDGYLADESTIEWSAGAIEDFLVQFVEHSGAATVHLFAHSMGNRGLLAAINSIAQKAQSRARIRFGQIILAAADVDADFFKNRYRAYTALADRTSLYVSTRDLAVGASQWLRGFPRVGLVPPLFVAEGIDTINVTNVDLTLLGHGYIADARSILNDMHRLLAHGEDPGKRGLRSKKNQDGESFWEFGA